MSSPPGQGSCNIGHFFATFKKCCKVNLFAKFLLQKNVARFFEKKNICCKVNCCKVFEKFSYVAKNRVANF